MIRSAKSDNTGIAAKEVFRAARMRLWTTRKRRILTIGVICVLAAPFLLLHGLVAYFGRREPSFANARARDVQAGGYSVRVYEAMTPDAKWDIVFAHGTPGDAGVFRRQFDRPSEASNVMAYDRPGFGWSTGAQPAPSLEFQVEALRRILPPVSTRRLLLAGHSYGAPVVLQAAIEMPERVAGVLLIGGAVDPGLERVLPIQTAGDTFPVPYLLPGVIRLTNRELITLKGDLEKLAARLKELKRPVLMLHGDRDEEVPVANVAYLEESLRRLGLERLFHEQVHAGVNHYIPWTRPELLEAALAELKRQAAAVDR